MNATNNSLETDLGKTAAGVPCYQVSSYGSDAI